MKQIIIEYLLYNKEYHAAYRQNHREQAREYGKKWRQINAEHVKERKKAQQAKYPDYNKNYHKQLRINHPERTKKYRQTWLKKNPDYNKQDYRQRLKNNSDYNKQNYKLRKNNPDHIAYQKQYRIQNLDKIKELNTHNIMYKGKRITLSFNPRKGICKKCSRKVGKEIKKTARHHKKYHDDAPLKDTIELCVRCHTKEHARLRANSQRIY